MMPEDTRAEDKSLDGIDVNEMNQHTRQREIQILSPEAPPQPQGIGSGVYDAYGKSAVFGKARDTGRSRVGPFPFRGGSSAE